MNESLQSLRTADSNADHVVAAQPSGVQSAVVRRLKALLFANTDWYLFNFRLPLARALKLNGFDVVMLCPPGPYVGALQAEGYRVIVIDMDRRSMAPWTELGVLRALWKIYRHEQPDVVHHFTIKCVVYGSLVAQLAGIRSRINAVAGLGYVYSNERLATRLLRPFVTALLRLALQGKASRLIVQNGDDAQRFVNQRLVSDSRLRLIRGSGVDTSRFAPRHAEADRAGPTVVLLATRLLWDKGVGEFVAAARLCRNHPIKFLLAGAPDEGNPSSVQRADVEQWQVEGIMDVLGHVDDMSELLQKVDIVILPTVYGEGVPRILLEAAASALPMIATDIAGCTEIVRHEITGLLVKRGDVKHLAEAIILLHRQPALRTALGQAARELATKEFDERLVLRSTLSVYGELTNFDKSRSAYNASPEQPDATPSIVAE